jgi:hypothetical protein
MSDGWAVNPFRSLSTAALLRERECRQWDLADIDAHPEGWQFAPESRVFLVWTLRQINDELTRRKRLAGKPNAPAWPNESPDRELERARERTEIKQRIRVSDLIHRTTHKYGEFERRRGNDVWCCCPLPGHDEDTPSFHFDDQQGLWHCFGCKRGGDLFELARHLWDEPEFWRVAERLRDLAGIERPARVQQPTQPNMVRPNGQPAIVRIASPRSRSYARR